jgi:hypothetical protein
MDEALISFVAYIDYPEEERAENQYKVVETQYHRTQTYLNKHSTAITLLIKAERTIRTCKNKLLEASRIYATWVPSALYLFRHF